MSQRIVVDPVTRLEGHLRIEAQIDGGQVVAAWSSATMWRGIESIIAGRDPRDAWYFSQRICGVCTTVHALASVRAVEDALGIEPPPQARTLRDLIAAAQFVLDHVVHFYHLHALDWVDVMLALSADPARTTTLASSISDYQRGSEAVFRQVRDRVGTFVRGGRLGPFEGGYWGHPAYRLPPEANLLLVSHYLDALDFQREFARVHALLGGKSPHPQTYLVGGMAIPIDPASPAAVNDDMLGELGRLVAMGRDFVRQVYLPDVMLIAGAYPEWAGIGRGTANYLSFGDFSAAPPRHGQPPAGGLFPAGLVRNADLTVVAPFRPERIAESVARSWYDHPGDGIGSGVLRAPWEGTSEPAYTGPKPPYDALDVDHEYSWVKAPRYDGLSVEVGPLARMLVGYAAGNALIRTTVDDAVHRLNATPELLPSTLGRTLARALETGILADHCVTLVERLRDGMTAGDLRAHDGTKWEPATWPRQARGVGFHEAPRGGLSHWVVIEDGKVARYQVVAPSTWNASPRDAGDQPGAYEAALVGTPVADPARPLEVLRTLHSFDPCMACAAHLIDADGNTVTEVRVQ